MPRAIGALALAASASVAVAGASPHVVARIPTGRAPCGAVAAFRAVWVANDGSGTLVRIDPRTNRVTRRIRVGLGACQVTAGAGGVWVTNYQRASVTRVEPQTGRVRVVAVGAEPFDALIAFGRVWVSGWGDGSLTEIDPATLKVVRRIGVGPNPAGLAAADGGVWVGYGREATSIARVDPVSGKVERVPVGVRAPGWFAVGTGGLWITANEHHLLQVDPATRRVVVRLELGRTLAHPAFAQDGTLWVPDKEQSIVFRVDPERARVVDSFRAGRGAFVALRAFGSMWVTSYAGSDVWRFKPAAGGR